MSSLSNDQKILKVISKFLKEDAKASKYLQKMAQKAEEDGDYYEYDEANYDYWEAGNQAGLDLAATIGGIIND